MIRQLSFNDTIVKKKGIEEAHKRELDNQYVAQVKKLKSFIK